LRAPLPARAYAQEMERKRYEMVLDALEQTQGNRTEAAKRLGIHRRALYAILERNKDRHA
jgi:transcriptional regulator with PAS, ATPase and Fis domain